MTDRTNILPAAPGRRSLTPVEAARRRLDRARANLARAERVEEATKAQVHGHGGPGHASDDLVTRLARAHERVFVSALEVWRCDRALTTAVAEQLNGGAA